MSAAGVFPFQVHPHHLILRSTPQACVSKDGQQAQRVYPCFETALRASSA